MNDDSIVKIMQSLGLDYSPAISSTLKFEKVVSDLNKELAIMKDNALSSVKDINNIFSSQLGNIGNKQILDQWGKPFKTIKDEAKATSTTVRDMAKSMKESSLAQMQAQAASIQQRATAKGLSDEYSKQAGTIREQLALVQARLQSEGKLSAEEVKQTQQLKEQLDILRAQTRAGISDKTRENPDWFGDEMQRRVSWFATGGVFYGMTNAAKEATQTIKEVEMGMVEIARVMTDSSFVFDEYRDNLFKLGVDYGQTFTNVQSVALRWAQSGYNVADSLELTKTSLLALNTAELDATQATEAMIGIMAQWNLQAEDMALVMDKINITADRHSVTSQDLVDGLLRSSGAARIMNLSLEETLGILTVMREASGRTGQEVGNALNSILSYIQRPGSIKTLEDLGISMFADSAKTQFRNVLDIFKDIASNWNTLSADIQDGFVKSADDANLFSEELSNALGMQEEWNDLQQRDISQAAAGVYRRNYFIGMIERLANVQGVLNNMMDAEGYSMRENADAMETLEKKQESLKASMEALAVAMGDAGVGGSLKILADGGTSALTMFTKLPKGAQDTISAFTSTFLVVKTLQLGMKTFGVELPKVSLSITDLKGSVLNLTSALKSGATGVGAFIQANAGLLTLSVAVGAIIAITNAIKKQREEQAKAIEVAKDNIKSYEEQRQGLIELSREYETLKDKEKNLTATADEKTRLKEIQKELVELYGVSITGIDTEGQAYADSTNAIQNRIKALEELKAIEEENLETAVKGRNNQDVESLKKHLAEKEQLETDLLKIQEQINKYTNALVNKEITTSLSGTAKIDGSTEHGAKILRDYISNLSREKSNLDKALGDVRNSIAEDTKETQQLLKEDAVKIANQLSQSGVTISDSARAYATELAKGLSQAPRNIFELRDELEKAIKEFTSSDFEEWSEKYQKAIANNDTKGIDETSNAIMRLVRNFAQGKPELDNFVLAMENAFGDSKAIRDTTKATFDLKTALSNMGTAAKKGFDDLKTLNQAIYDVKRGQSLSIDTILDLIEKYNLNTEAVKQTTKGYTVEVSALENLRQAKIQTATDGIKSEMDLANAVKTQVESRIKNYGLEIEQLKNLATARVALQRIAHEEAIKKANAISDVTKVIDPLGIISDKDFGKNYNQYFDDEMKSLESDLANYENAIKFLEEAEKRSNMLEDMLNDKNYGVSTSKSKDKKDERKFLDSIDAEIRAIKTKNDNLEKTSDLLNKQLNLANSIEGLKGLNEQHRITGRIIENNRKIIKSYQKEQDELHKKANDLRNANKNYNIDLWFDSNAEQTVAYINQYNKATKSQQENMDKVFQQMQRIKKAWLESNSEAKNLVSTTKDLERELSNIVIKQEEMTRNKLREIIEAEKRNAYMDLEYRQRLANEQLKLIRQQMESEIASKQSQIDRIQDEIDRIQENERLRQENIERSKRLEEISRLEDRYYALQNKELSDLTEEQTELLGLEREREAYLKRQEDIEKEKIKRQEYENELLELRNKLDNIRNQKTIRQYKELADGTWDFDFVVDQDAIDNVEKQIKDTEEKVKDSNERIEDLEKQHSKELKDLQKQTLKDLQKAKEDYDEWEYQNDLKRQIEAKQRRIKEYQDEIKDLQDKYAEKERLTNEAFATEKENLDRYYMDIDKLTDEAMTTLHETFGQHWVEIYGTLTGFFDDIAREYDALVDKLSTPLPTPKYGAGEQGFYSPPDGSGNQGSSSSGMGSSAIGGGIGSIIGGIIGGGPGSIIGGTIGGIIGNVNKKHEGGIVGDGNRDLPHLVNKFFNTKPNEQMVKALKGELFIPEENIYKNFLPNMQTLMDVTTSSLVANVSDTLKSIQTTQSLVPSINVPSLDRKSINRPTVVQNQSTTQPAKIVHNHIDKLVFPDVHDAREIEDAILNLPRTTIQNK
ncbi:phage tail tape measure protein [Tissierella pigra]|uniref:Phage tail tape measure protein n=1 Tax=Tissierella pigra TaxID=2607614 RepID=A0A6N7XIR5_9FIRM|nr:phage tail tape measure protein [Tissierella pigra]MSU01929.1 phage tail tape measure protein [Tissierella pigra]